MSMNTVPERLAALRAAMQANGVDFAFPSTSVYIEKSSS